jgi:ATP-dependent DNA helicase RecQ
MSRESHAVEPERLLSLARERFGVSRFRRGQRALIESVLQGRDALGILPTGAGKSLTYQLPALLMPRPVLVVSPLISLMQDQQDKLEALEITSAQLNSTLRVREEREVVEQLRDNELELIYITPERLENPEYLAMLKQTGVSLFVVDEAHCVSTWGHDFRPAYLALRDARRQLGNPPLLALTATATPEMVDDILKQLGAEQPRIVQLAVERKSLRLEVVRTPRAGQKRENLLALLKQEQGAGIVYVATIKKAEELHAWLCQQGVPAGLYHGKLSASEREDTQHRFMADELKVMVATNAFGLGIDKQDLRFVVHFNFPDSLETYYQEAGRAGRDGKQARAVLLYRLEDKRLQSYFLGGKYPRRDESLRVLQQVRALAKSLDSKRGLRVAELAKAADLHERKTKVIVAQLEGAGIVARKRDKIVSVRDVADEDELNALLDAYEEKRKTDGSRLELMMRYAQTGRCRTQFLNEYFGEESEARCDHCDNCLSGGPLAEESTLDQAAEDDDDREARLLAAKAANTAAQERLERLVASAVGNVEPEAVS